MTRHIFTLTRRLDKMIKRKYFTSLAVLLMSALFLAGCGTDSGSLTGATDQNPDQAAVQTASVTFQVQFPQSALKKAMIDGRTTQIQIQWQDYTSYNFLGEVLLTPDANGLASATVNVPIGLLSFTAWAYEEVPDPYNPGMTMFQELEMTSTAGDIVAGNNTVYLSFLTGDWQLVDANDNPTTLAVGTGASARTLSGFSLESSFGHGMYSKATVDPTKPMGFSDFSLQWYGPTGALGDSAFAYADFQFTAGATNNNSLGSDFFNLSTPFMDENYDDSFFPSGERVLFLLESGPDNGTIVAGNGTDLTPTLNQYADTQLIDGTHIGGHLLEMTADSSTKNLTSANVDCAPYWTNYGTAARAQAVKSAYAQSLNGPAKAAPGDATTLAASMVVSYEECVQQPSSTDGDGDGDMSQDFLTIDVNANGLYDPADGDEYIDYNNDGNFDWVVYNQVDGDGDGDMAWDYLTLDLNHNNRFDAGDSFQDIDGDGVFDYVYTPGDLYAITENYSEVVAREFRAKGSQILSQFTPTILGGWANSSASNSQFAITLLDATHYIFVEDGVADTDPATGAVIGGPGMEYGTYTIDATAATMTFTASTDTTGDWGPAGSSTSTVGYEFTATNQLKISGTDPLDPWFENLNRAISNWNPGVGSWKYGSEATGMQVVTLLANGDYLVASLGADPAANLDGMERGTYSMSNYPSTDATTGDITVNLSFTGQTSTLPDVNNSVVAAPGQTVTETVTMSADGSTLTFDNNGTLVSFSRVR